MTPYWPSPLGATRRRLAPRPVTLSFAAELFPAETKARRRFPRPNRGMKWVADADLPSPQDFNFGTDCSAPELG